jgi:succinate dehydrogenase hydrophobic anchor subunit
MNSLEKIETDQYLNSGAKERIGIWAWFGIYLSALILLFFLISHICMIHYGSNHIITAKSVSSDLRSYFVAVVDIGLLAICIFHGLAGFRSVVLDLEIFGRRGDRYFIYSLIIIGVCLLMLGIIIFDRFTSVMI